MEVSALKHAGVAGRHGRSPLLRLQSDERLIALIRRGNEHAFEALMSRYHARLLAFCRHMLGSREDAEDVLQEVFAAAFNAIQADERTLNVRPWLYRIARNRSLNHLRRTQPIATDSMDLHLSENGQTTADKVHKREEFRLLIADVHGLPETQRTALLLREMDALSYEQIAEAMETTIPSVKSLLVRARVSLAEAAEARLLSCEEVRTELGEVAEGLRKRTSPAIRRHVRTCDHCGRFRSQLRRNNRALAAVFPVAPLLLAKKFVLAHFGTTAGAGGGATAAGTAATTAAGTSAGTAAGTMAAGSAVSGMLSAGATTVASKAAAGMAAAALVTAGAVEVRHVASAPQRSAQAPSALRAAPAPAAAATATDSKAAAEDAQEKDKDAKDAKKKGEKDPKAVDGKDKPGRPQTPQGAAVGALAGPAAPPAPATQVDGDITTLPNPATPAPIQTTEVPPPAPPAAPAPPADAQSSAPSQPRPPADGKGSGGLSAPGGE